MSELDELIQVDAENISNSRKALTDFDPELSAALDTAAGMFKTFSRCMIGRLDDSADDAAFVDCARELGIDGDTLFSRIRSEARDPALDRARTAYYTGLARRARVIIFLLLRRQFMWGATDLLRGRRTAAIGYGRQEAEALALLFLMRNDPTVGSRWLKAGKFSDGKSFYQEFQPRIRDEIHRLNLSVTYEMGSGASLHVRLASAVPGLLLSDSPNEFRLSYQEGWEEDPFTYFCDVVFFLQIQERVFRSLGDAFPEVSDPIWPECVRIFARTINSLWERLEEAFPEQRERHQRMAAEIQEDSGQ